MRRFTDLYARLDATMSTSQKTEALADYFARAPHADAAWAAALILGERPKGSASSRALQAMAIDRARVPPWLFDACRAAVGDLSETIALVLPDDRDESAGPEPLHRVVEDRVVPLAGASEEDRRAIIEDAWRRFDRDERYVYLKLVRGGFRVGVQRRLLARALARVAGVDRAVMEHRLAGGFTPTPEAFAKLLDQDAADERRRRPYPFFLAAPIDGNPADLGDRADWLAEWKWDGIRVQVMRRDGDVAIWSRGDELITHQFPEVEAAARALPDDVVIDGELLVWEDDRPLPFAALQTRLNRKRAPTDQPLLFETRRPVVVAFDLVEDRGEDLRDQPQSTRRARLEAVVGDLDDDTIRLSPVIDAPSWEALRDLRETARDRGAEGMMLKHRASPYLAGRVKPADSPGWLKWKVDPRTVDAVLVYAYPGSGRRATLFTDYAFAVWDDERTELVTFTRAYSGLDQAEVESLDAWIRRHTVRKMGPARSVEPTRVFEVGFEGIARSPRHKAGVAVRFPRILRERTDKGPDDADDLVTLLAMLPEGTGR